MLPLMNLADTPIQNGKMECLSQMLSKTSKSERFGMSENQGWFDSREKTISEICQHGLLDDIKKFHEEDEHLLKEPDENGWTALHYASRYNQREIIEFLVKTGNVDVNTVTDDDVTPLHLAVSHNCHEAVRCLLDNGADASMKNNNGESAIHLVGKRGDKELITFLLSDYHTDLQCLDKNHRTALHHACFHGNTITCETLLNKGAELEAQTLEGLTPLHVAIIGDHEEIVKLLIKRAKERNVKVEHFVNISDKNGTKPLHLCARGGLLNIMEVLLRHNADVNAQRILSGRGYSALHLAAAGGDLKMCRMLLNYDAELDIRDYDGCTPLHRAAARNHETVVTFLLSKGAALTLVDKNGITCFLHAVQEGYTLLAELILKRDNSQIYQRTKKSRCCVHLAVINRHKPLLMMLLRNGGSKYTNAIDYNNRTPLHYAAALGDSEVIRILLQHGSNPDTLDIHSQTPLHLACKADNLKCVKMILDQSMISLNIVDDTGNTALHTACKNGNTLVTSYLLKHGADVSFADVNGDTALHCAVRSGCLGVCASLLDYCASCDTVNGDRETSLHEAAKGDNADIVVLLLDKKANTEVKNKREKTFLDLAIDNAHDDVLEAIMNHHSVTRSQDIAKRTETISKILTTHPSVAIALLDRGITLSEHSHSDLEFQISYDFRDLDPGPRAGQRRFATLKSLVKDRQEKILSHPLVRKMLSHKWNKFGRNIYLVGLLTFIVFHFCLCYFTITERQYAMFHDNSTKYTEDVASHKDRNIGLISFLFIMAMLCVLKEIFQMFLRGLRYFTNYENLVELAYYFFTMLFLAPYIYIHSNKENDIPDIVISGQNWVLGILAVFLGWLDFVLYLRSYMFPTLGLYITMFFEILKTFTRIFSVIFLFLLGYASVFYIIFPKQETFSNVGVALITSTVMMIGEIGYRETLIDTSGSTLLPFPVLSFIVFTIFVITMAILLANLLIGLAVGDIDVVQSNANMSLIAMLVDYVTEIEEKLPMFIQKRLYVSRLAERPNVPLPRKVSFFNRLLWELTGDPGCQSQHAVHEVLKNRFHKAKFEDSQKLFRIEAKLYEQQRSIKQLRKLALSQTKLLQGLTTSLGLGHEQNPTIIDGLSTEYGYRSRYTWLH